MHRWSKNIILISLLPLFLCACDDEVVSSEESEELVNEIYVQHEFENILDPIEEGYFPDAPLSDKDAYILRLKGTDSLYDINGYELTHSLFYEEFDDEGERSLISRETNQTLSLYEDGYSVLDGYRITQTKQDEEIVSTVTNRRKREVAIYNNIRYSTYLSDSYSMSRDVSSSSNTKEEWLVRNDKHLACLDYDLYSISGGFLALSTSSVTSSSSFINEEGESVTYTITTNNFDACYFSGSVYQPRWVGRSKGNVVHSYVNEDFTEATTSSRVTSYEIEAYAFNNGEANQEEAIEEFLSSFGSYYISNATFYLVGYVPNYDDKSNLSSVAQESVTELPAEQYQDEVSSSSYERCFVGENGLTNNRVYTMKADLTKVSVLFDGASETQNSESITIDVPYIATDNNFYLNEDLLNGVDYFSLSKWYLNGKLWAYLTCLIDQNSGDITASATIEFE